MNIVQHFYRSTEFRRDNLIGVCGNYLTVLGFLTANHLAFLITPLQTYLAHLQFTEAQQETSKASLLTESIAIASPWCEAVLYSPDPPFLFGGRSGNETTPCHAAPYRANNGNFRKFMPTCRHGTVFAPLQCLY